VAFEISTTACEAAPIAFETRSEFLYKISASSSPSRSRFGVDLQMAVALWAKWGSAGFPAMRKAMGRGQDV
jgi:hypothetical protein